MREAHAREGISGLRAMVLEASRALALLDAPRLQELALSCEALKRQLGQADAGLRRELAGQAREAADDMEVFRRVLEATRANLNVMRRLRAMRWEELEYKVPGAGAVAAAEQAENGDGNN